MTEVDRIIAKSKIRRALTVKQKAQRKVAAAASARKRRNRAGGGLKWTAKQLDGKRRPTTLFIKHGKFSGSVRPVGASGNRTHFEAKVMDGKTPGGHYLGVHGSQRAAANAVERFLRDKEA